MHDMPYEYPESDYAESDLTYHLSTQSPIMALDYLSRYCILWSCVPTRVFAGFTQVRCGVKKSLHRLCLNYAGLEMSAGKSHVRSYTA